MSSSSDLLTLKQLFGTFSSSLASTPTSLSQVKDDLSTLQKVLFNLSSDEISASLSRSSFLLSLSRLLEFCVGQDDTSCVLSSVKRILQHIFLEKVGCFHPPFDSLSSFFVTLSTLTKKYFSKIQKERKEDQISQLENIFLLAQCLSISLRFCHQIIELQPNIQKVFKVICEDIYPSLYSLFCAFRSLSSFLLASPLRQKIERAFLGLEREVEEVLRAGIFEEKHLVKISNSTTDIFGDKEVPLLVSSVSEAIERRMKAAKKNEEKKKEGKESQQGGGRKRLKKDEYLNSLFDCFSSCYSSDTFLFSSLTSPHFSQSSIDLILSSSHFCFLETFYRLFVNEFQRIKKKEDYNEKRGLGKMKSRQHQQQTLSSSHLLPFWFFVSCVNQLKIPLPLLHEEGKECTQAHPMGSGPREREEEKPLELIEENRKRKRSNSVSEKQKIDQRESPISGLHLEYPLSLFSKLSSLRSLLRLLLKTEIGMQQQKKDSKSFLFLKFLVSLCVSWLEVAQCHLSHFGDTRDELAVSWGGVASTAIECLEQLLQIDHSLLLEDMKFIWRFITPHLPLSSPFRDKLETAGLSFSFCGISLFSKLRQMDSFFTTQLDSLNDRDEGKDFLYYIPSSSLVSSTWKWNFGQCLRNCSLQNSPSPTPQKRSKKEKRKSQDISFIESGKMCSLTRNSLVYPLIFVYPAYLERLGNNLEQQPALLLHSALCQIVRVTANSFRDYFEQDGEKRERRVKEIYSICHLVTILTVFLERIAITSSLVDMIRDTCELIVSDLFLPFLPQVFSCWKVWVQETHSLNPSLSASFDINVMMSVMIQFFHATVRVYECCFQFESEAEAKQIGSVAETGYFGYIDEENEIEEKDEFKRVNSKFDSLLSLLSDFPRPPSNLLRSPSLLRCGISLLLVSVHFLQEAVRISKKELAQEVVSFLINEVSLYDWYLSKARDSAPLSVFPIMGNFWCNQTGYVALHWKIICDLLCSLNFSSLSLEAEGEGKGGEETVEWKHAFGDSVTYDPISVFPPNPENALMNVFLKTILGVWREGDQTEMDEEMVEKCGEERVLSLLRETSMKVLQRATFYEKRGRREFLVSFARFRLQRIFQIDPKSLSHPRVLTKLKNLVEFLSLIHETYSSWTSKELLPIFLEVIQFEVHFLQSLLSLPISAAVEDFIVGIRRFLLDLLLTETADKISLVSLLANSDFCDYFVTTCRILETILLPNSRNECQILSQSIWRLICRVFSQLYVEGRIEKSKKDSGEKSSFSELVQQIIIELVENLNVPLEAGIPWTSSQFFWTLETILDLQELHPLLIEGCDQLSSLSISLSKWKQHLFYSDSHVFRPLSLGESVQEKKLGISSFSLGEICLFFVNFVSFQKKKEKKKKVQEGVLLDELLGASVVIVQACVENQSDCDDEMRCLQAVDKIILLWNQMTSLKRECLLSHDRVQNSFAILIALMEKMHQKDLYSPLTFKRILDLSFSLIKTPLEGDSLEDQLAFLTELLFQLKWSFSSLSLKIGYDSFLQRQNSSVSQHLPPPPPPSFSPYHSSLTHNSFASLPTNQTNFSLLPPDPPHFSSRGALLLLIFSRIISSLSSLPSKIKSFLRAHLPEIGSVCLALLTEKTTSQTLFDFSFPLPITLFDFVVNVEGKEERRADVVGLFERRQKEGKVKKQTNLFELTMHLLSVLAIREKAADHFPEFNIAILHSIISMFPPRIQAQTKNLNLTSLEVHADLTLPFSVISCTNGKRGRKNIEELLSQSCQVFLQIYFLLQGLVHQYIHQLLPHMSSFISALQFLFSALLNILQLSSLCPDKRKAKKKIYLCVQNLSRLYQLLSSDFSGASHYVPFLIFDFLSAIKTYPMTSEIRALLLPGIFSLIDICSEHQLGHLHQTLPPSSQTTFKALHSEYGRTYKFKGFS